MTWSFRRPLRILGWLLTPFVAWAASFFGGWLGAKVLKTLTGMVVGAVAGGIAGTLLWVMTARWRNRALRIQQDDEAGRNGEDE